jgi:hypothetical protein
MECASSQHPGSWDVMAVRVFGDGNACMGFALHGQLQSSYTADAFVSMLQSRTLCWRAAYAPPPQHREKNRECVSFQWFRTQYLPHRCLCLCLVCHAICHHAMGCQTAAPTSEPKLQGIRTWCTQQCREGTCIRLDPGRAGHHQHAMCGASLQRTAISVPDRTSSRAMRDGTQVLKAGDGKAT